MKLVQETDMYQYMNGGLNSKLDNRIRTLINGGMINVSQHLGYNLKTIERSFRDPLTTATLNEVSKGLIIPFVSLDPQNMMPSYMPFIKFIPKSGNATIAVDLTGLSSVRNDINGELDININNNKLYTMLVTSYVYLNFSNKSSTLTPVLNKYTSAIWARIIVNIFNNELGLSTNRERLNAFEYFAQKFFLVNVLEVAPAIYEADATYDFGPGNKKSSYIVQMEELIHEKGIDMWSSFTTFITTLLNADITGLNQRRASIKNGSLGIQWFMSKYIATYGTPAGFSVASFPYFMWMLFSANNSSWIFAGDRKVEAFSKSEYPKIMNELYRMIRN